MKEAAYEHNGQPVGKEAFYRLACDPQRHAVVEACAGAGKTWMLVSRILRALLDGVAPHEILAITFTKKAAGEMRQRLLQWLAECAQADDARLAEELRIRGVEEHRIPALIAPLRGLHAQVLAHGRGVQIRTFHSWFAALLRQAPLSVLQQRGLPPAFELLEDDEPAVARLWRPFHARLLREPQARSDYEALVQTHGRSQTLKALRAALERRVEFELADAAGVVDASVPPASALQAELAAVAEPALWLAQPAVRARWQERARLLQQEKTKTPQKAAEAIGAAYARLDQGDAQAAAEALQTLRKGFFVQKEDRLNDKLQGFAAARQAEAELQRLLAAQRQHQAWLHQQRLARLTRILIDEYAALKREQGWVDMNDVERAALHLLKDATLSAWVQERLDARTRQLLIDEFQDTNPLQWQALYAWLSAYAGSGGGQAAPVLFIVGDPKQSIYRFRRAEPQVFRAAQDFVRQLGGELLSCDHTRRNARAVLRLVNDALQQAQDEGDYSGFREHTTESAEEGAVLALPPIPRPERAAKETAGRWRDSLSEPRHTVEETLRERECRQAARWIAQRIAAGVPAGEIMVLARKRDRLAAMEAELRALGIAAVQPEKTDLGEAPEVQDLLALLDVLVSPTHDLSLARALKSPLFGLGDEALIQLALRQRQNPRPWLELLLDAGWDDDGPLRAAGPRLRRWQQWVTQLPPHDALHAIYDDGDVLARYAVAVPAPLRARVLANLRALLLAALQHDGGRYASPYAFIRAVRAGGIQAPQAGGPDAVQLLTVHGAKGLEADVVLLLDTDAPPPAAQSMGVLLQWPGQSPQPQRLIFLASESEVAPLAREPYAQEQAERQREELNALYVALTRARRQLVLSAVQPHRDSGRSWWKRLAPQCQSVELDDAAVSSATAAATAIELPLLPALAQPAAEPQPGALDGIEARIGSAMHRLLQWAELDAQDIPAAQLARVAAEFALDAAQARQAAAMAQRILGGQGAWAWRSAELLWHGNEVPVVHGGQIGRIDRLVRRRDGSWWVLDYKSAARPDAQEALRAQLAAYRAAVQAASPGQPVHAAFLTAAGTLLEVQL
ncbi:MAG: UvrD-helicase domain-containing protein [Hylemonella sp.]